MKLPPRTAPEQARTCPVANGKPALAVNATARLYDCYDCGGRAPGEFIS
jgi:hypothetical protein